MAENGNHARGLNGNSLASLSGAKTRVEEHVVFDSASLAAAVETIRKLGGTGQLTVRFLSGRPAGDAEWKTSRKEVR